jgi:hypothetical protein
MLSLEEGLFVLAICPHGGRSCYLIVAFAGLSSFASNGDRSATHKFWMLRVFFAHIHAGDWVIQAWDSDLESESYGYF